MSVSPVVEALHFYPIKSCGAVDLKSAYAGPRGFVVGKILDRSWMLVDEGGVMVSQRQDPRLARIKIELLDAAHGEAEAFRVSGDGLEPVVLSDAVVSDGRTRVIIHGKETVGHVAHPEISQWFSRFLGKPVTAIHQKDEDLRLCDARFAINAEEDSVSFADGFPYLVTAQATLEMLNAELETPVSMQRFRPNIVVGNSTANAEYTWRAITLGSASLSLVKPCTRCVMTTIDQNTGVKTGKEPLATLARVAFLAQDFGTARVQGAVFGENALATMCGQISVGDRVQVVETKPVYLFRQAGAPVMI